MLSYPDCNVNIYDSGIYDGDNLSEIWQDADILAGQYIGSFRFDLFSNFLIIDTRRTRFTAEICGSHSEIPTFTGGEHHKQHL